jgi:hypothetical protein
MPDMVKVVQVDDQGLKFDDGSSLSSEHESDCCESHYLSFSGLSPSDFEGLDFDLSTGGDFFEKVDGFGIRLLPTNGHPVSVPGYGYNNGYYSYDLTLVLERPGAITKFDVSECQVIND